MAPPLTCQPSQGVPMRLSSSRSSKPDTLRRQLMLFATVPLLTACAGPWHERPSATPGYPPFLGGKPTVVEYSVLFAPMATGNPSKARYRQKDGLRSIDWDEVEGVYQPLTTKATSFGMLPLTKDALGMPVPIDKRLFLVSVRPSILLLVPHKYPPLSPGVRIDARYPIDQPVSIQFQRLKDAHSRQFGAMHGSTPGSDRNILFFVEISSAFPDLEGILAVSDRWEGVRTLEQLEADPSLPFKTTPAGSMPGWRRLALR